MPTKPPPQVSIPEPSAKPTQRSAEASPSGPDAPKPAWEGTLFHLLVERGWGPELAYTANQRIHAMTSEIVAAGLEPVMAELRQMREAMAGFATKAELRAELRGNPPPRQIRRESMVTKADLAERETRLIKWMFGAMLAQTAVIVGIVVGVVPLLK